MLGEGAATATWRGGGRGNLGFGEEVADGGDGGLDLGAKRGRKGDVLPAAGGAVENRAGGDVHAHHLLQTKGLGAELESIGVVFLGSSAFVFDGEGRSALTELDDVGLADEAEAFGDELEAAAGTDTATTLVAGLMDVFVQETALGGEAVFFPNASDVNESALAGADPPVLKGGEWDALRGDHWPSSLSGTRVMLLKVSPSVHSLVHSLP